MLNILYVGWDIETVEALARIVENTGHRLISTYKNDHALFHVCGDAVDFIMLDYDDDSILDVLGILREARRRRPLTPIIMLTSLALTKDTLRHAIRELGDLRIIRKPFVDSVVLRTMMEMVNASEFIGDKYRLGATQHRRSRDFVDRRRATRRSVNLPLEFSLAGDTQTPQPDGADPSSIHFGKVKDVGDGGFLFHAETDLPAELELNTSIRMRQKQLRTRVAVVRSLPLGDHENQYAIAVKFLN